MNRHVGTLALAALAVFAPIQGTLIAALGLILVDLASGIWAAKKRGEPITSRGLRRSIVKLCVYESTLVLAFLVEHYLVGAMPLLKICASFIGVTELKSALENFNNIAGGDVLRGLLNRLGGPPVEK